MLTGVWIVVDLKEFKSWLFHSEKEAWHELEHRRTRATKAHKPFILLRGLIFDTDSLEQEHETVKVTR